MAGESEAGLRRASRAENQHANQEMIAASRDMQTEVIRYIANVAEPFNVRMRHLEANAGNLDGRTPTVGCR